jgi:phosphotransferase system enzyme I (PtsP)
MGVAVLHRPTVAVTRIVAEDPAVEQRRLREAVARMHDALDEMLADSNLAGAGEHHDILESYRMFAADRGWLQRITEAIETGLTADAAVQMVQNETRARMAQVSDPYIRERLQDLEDLANRLMQHLADEAAAGPRPVPAEDLIVVARTMGPAELLDYQRGRLRGLVLEEGSPTAHVAIVARALDIPVVGRVPQALNRFEPLDPVTVDGDHGIVYARPRGNVRQAFGDTIAARARRQRAYRAIRELPAITRDGVEVTLNINAGLLGDLDNLHECGASGVGLYRTEIPFMVQPAFPDVAEQQRLYRQVLERARGKPVVFRTLDIGGDKLLPYFERRHDENPAMGWRSIRIALDRPAMLRQQLRALIRAAAGDTLRVMFPMVAEVAEFEAARRILELELEHTRGRGHAPPTRVEVGVMLEVPSLAWQLPTLLGRVDFVSVGSNDLFQFLFASDRGNPRLVERYDSLSPPALAFLREVVRVCAALGKSLALCGEMAGRPLEAMVLVGLGFRNLSMAPSAIGPVKAMIRSLAERRLCEYMEHLYLLSDHSVREKLRNFARDHAVTI